MKELKQDGMMAGTVNELQPTEHAGTTECPAPLSCLDVLAEFETQAQRWTIPFRGRQIVGRTWGSGPPLYFLNGLGGTHALNAFVAWLLREQFRCVLFDYPSRPRRGPGAQRFRSHDYVAVLGAVAEYHGDPSFPVFATSFGAQVALQAMLDEPSLIERAVLQGGFARRQLSLVERLLVSTLGKMPGCYRGVPLRRRIQQYNHQRWFPPFDHRRWDFLVENTGSVPIADMAERAALIRDTDLRPRLAEITQPILLIHSEGDGLVAESCHRELESGLPNARSQWLAHCGHLPAVTHPHRLSRLLREFLAPDADSSNRNDHD